MTYMDTLKDNLIESLQEQLRYQDRIILLMHRGGYVQEQDLNIESEVLPGLYMPGDDVLLTVTVIEDGLEFTYNFPVMGIDSYNPQCWIERSKCLDAVFTWIDS